jgi:hypothetical protein
MKKDRILKPDENNMIDSCKKLSTWGVYHNFHKSPEVLNFNSALANEFFLKLISPAVPIKVEYRPYNGDPFLMGDSTVKEKLLDMIKWLDDSCSGYYTMIDYNIFFELEADRALFLLKFV